MEEGSRVAWLSVGIWKLRGWGGSGKGKISTTLGGRE
jgi:hypothetical protein